MSTQSIDTYVEISQFKAKQSRTNWSLFTSHQLRLQSPRFFPACKIVIMKRPSWSAQILDCAFRLTYGLVPAPCPSSKIQLDWKIFCLRCVTPGVASGWDTRVNHFFMPRSDVMLRGTMGLRILPGLKPRPSSLALTRTTKVPSKPLTLDLM
jgi:hypothetical protein